MFIIEDFVPVHRPPLLGFARARSPMGFIFHDVPIKERNGRMWAMPGSAPRLDLRGRQMRDRAGVAQWIPVVSFATPEVRDRFSQAIIEALRVYKPDLFADQSQALS